MEEAERLLASSRGDSRREVCRRGKTIRKRRLIQRSSTRFGNSSWRKEAPREDIDLTEVRAATDLLAAVSRALDLPGSYGANLDKFAKDLVESVDMPRLSLRGWDRIAKLMPRDAELLLDCIRELGKEYPEV